MCHRDHNHRVAADAPLDEFRKPCSGCASLEPQINSGTSNDRSKQKGKSDGRAQGRDHDATEVRRYGEDADDLPTGWPNNGAALPGFEKEDWEIFRTLSLACDERSNTD